MILRSIATLALLCASANAGQPADRYAARLKSLDTTRPESACTARDLLRQQLRLIRPASPDSVEMFRAFVQLSRKVEWDSVPGFRDAVQPVANRIDEVLTATGDRSRSVSGILRDDPAIDKAIGPWLECGASIVNGEGYWGNLFDPASQLEFGPFLPAPLQAWIKFDVAEDQNIVEDAGLIISWSQLAEKLKRWEDFARAYPDLKETVSDVKPFVLSCASVLFLGLDNSHIADMHPGDASAAIDPEVLAAWQWFAQADPKSRYAATAHGLLVRLKQNDNRLTLGDLDSLGWIYREDMDDRKLRKPW